MSGAPVKKTPVQFGPHSEGWAQDISDALLSDEDGWIQIALQMLLMGKITPEMFLEELELESEKHRIRLTAEYEESACGQDQEPA